VRFKTVKRLVFVLLVAVATATSADVTGTWTAQTIIGPSGSETPVATTFTFKVEGGKLTGTVKSPHGNHQILDGKVEGDSITFSVLVTASNNRFKMLYDGKITADGIDFISKIEGNERSDHFLAKRLSA
jgi:hypothetical protein